MHNFNRTGFSFAHRYGDFRKGLHKRKASFLDREHFALIAAHNGFDHAAERGSLNQLTPLWKSPGPKEKHPSSDYWVAHSLYDNVDLPELEKELTRLNGGRKLICPLCGLKEVEDMDHFLPREIFPEFSSHYSNLIPTCHKCNNTKLAQWLDDQGRQIFFNAFYDKDIPQPFIICEVNVYGGVPIAEVDFSPTLLPSNPQHFRIRETLSKLGLIDKYTDLANEKLRDLINEVLDEYRVNKFLYPTMDVFIESRKRVFEQFLKTNEGEKFLEEALYRGCLASADFWLFISANLP